MTTSNQFYVLFFWFELNYLYFVIFIFITTYTYLQYFHHLLHFRSKVWAHVFETSLLHSTLNIIIINDIITVVLPSY